MTLQDLIKAVEKANRKIYVEIPNEAYYFDHVNVIDADILLAELKKMEE